MSGRISAQAGNRALPEPLGEIGADAQDSDEGALLERLRSGIECGSLVENGKVQPERALAERLGVGRTRLRSALDVLEAEGSIFRRHGQGTFAGTPPADARPVGSLARQVTPRDILEVRQELEPALAALAAERATRDDITLLNRMMRATLSVKDSASYETMDDIFHFKIAEIAGNPLFLSIYQSIRTVRRQSQWINRRKLSHSTVTIARLGEQHRQLTQSIEAGDAAAAAESMRAHLTTVSQTMLRDSGFEELSRLRG